MLSATFRREAMSRLLRGLGRLALPLSTPLTVHRTARLPARRLRARPRVPLPVRPSVSWSPPLPTCLAALECPRGQDQTDGRMDGRTEERADGGERTVPSRPPVCLQFPSWAPTPLTPAATLSGAPRYGMPGVNPLSTSSAQGWGSAVSFAPSARTRPWGVLSAR